MQLVARDAPSLCEVNFRSKNTYFEIARDLMLGMGILSGPHGLLTRFYDICDGFHAKIRASEHFYPQPYPRLAKLLA